MHVIFGGNSDPKITGVNFQINHVNDQHSLSRNSSTLEHNPKAMVMRWMS